VLTAATAENLTLNLTLETEVRAPIETTFESLLAQVGRLNQTPDGQPMPLILEARPGGRWYRDLGGDNGHFWGHVQAIKRPTLLEFCGPLFMSNPVMSNVQYRLKEVDSGTLIVFRHTALGFIADDHKPRLAEGWTALLDRIRKAAESGRNGS
jgi:uncharacterized protein YndB with AHSA1/START domain